jgi:transaldolase/glucose-6-phosphate isomerase
LGVNAFDQPDVQDSKNRTVAKISYYRQHGAFDESKPSLEEQGILVYGKLPTASRTVTEIIGKFLAQGNPGEYVAINAYLKRDRQNEASLQALRSGIRAKTKLATTVGFGPRFLHSTGQLHKGGANNGLFLVITSDSIVDLKIPGQGLSFSALEHGQALGDLEALEARGRRVLHIHLTNPGKLKILVNKLVTE